MRSNDPQGRYNNTLPKDLVFRGRTLLEVEDVWNDQRTYGTRFDGEIHNRLAIYEALDPPRYIAEQLRYNGRVLLLDPEMVHDHPLPFLSFSQRFATLEEAVNWIARSEMISEGSLRDVFVVELARLGIEPPPSLRTNT